MKKYDIGTSRCYVTKHTNKDKSALIILIDTSVYVIAADELLSDEEVMLIEYVDCTSVDRAYNVWVGICEDIKMRPYDSSYYAGRKRVNSKALLQSIVVDRRFSAIDTMYLLFVENTKGNVT